MTDDADDLFDFSRFQKPKPEPEYLTARLKKAATPEKLHVDLGLRENNVAQFTGPTLGRSDESPYGTADMTGVIRLPINRNRRLKPTSSS